MHSGTKHTFLAEILAINVCFVPKNENVVTASARRTRPGGRLALTSSAARPYQLSSS